MREACGNTVRNITASPIAGIDPNEVFDVTPYAQEMFQYFLRNPICQEMGRKIKIAFSSNEQDTAMVFMHDIGFIPKVKIEQGKTIRGFKVFVGGGLGAQPFLAHISHEFLPEDQIIPFTEALLRVFDRHGERVSRHKARLKFLINKISIQTFLNLVEAERTAIKVKTYPVNYQAYESTNLPPNPSPVTSNPTPVETDELLTSNWFKTNVFEQKQKGYYAVSIKVLTGDIKTPIARKLAAIVQKYAGDDIRITINQGLLLKYVPYQHLSLLYNELKAIGLAEPGFDSTADITTCPGTDTCNLGISNSTGIAAVFEKVITEEYPELIFNTQLKIKISGCMNGCGQHSIANIGFHGSSLKAGVNVIPALQVLLGGGIVGNGTGRVGDKITKIPSKRGPQVLRTILNDYETNATDGEYFNTYYDRKGENYFYQLLKPFTDLTQLEADDFVDWGHDVKYTTAIGVGECAGVMIDLVATLLYEAQEKFEWATESLKSNQYADSIYHSYSVHVNTAKALLLDKQISCNTQIGIIQDFDKHYVQTGIISFPIDFKTQVLQINQNEPSEQFATNYYNQAKTFLNWATNYRKTQLL